MKLEGHELQALSAAKRRRCWAIILVLKNSDLKKAYFEKVTGISFDNIFRKKVERLKQLRLIERE